MQVNFNVKIEGFTDVFFSKLDSLISEPWELWRKLQEEHAVYGSRVKLNMQPDFSTESAIRHNNCDVTKIQKRGYFAYCFTTK